MQTTKGRNLTGGFDVVPSPLPTAVASRVITADWATVCANFVSRNQIWFLRCTLFNFVPKLAEQEPHLGMKSLVAKSKNRNAALLYTSEV